MSTDVQTRSGEQSPLVDVVLTAMFAGAVPALVGSLFIPPLLATICGIILAYITLRSDGITGSYAAVTALVFVFIWLGGQFQTLSDRFYPAELFGYLVIGGLGLGYLGIQRQLRRAGSRIRKTDSSIGTIVTNTAGIAAFIGTGISLIRMVSVRSFVAIGIIPGVLLNMFFRTLDLGFLSEFVISISSLGTLALIFALSLSLDTASQIYAGISGVLRKGHQEGPSQSEATQRIGHKRGIDSTPSSQISAGIERRAPEKGKNRTGADLRQVPTDDLYDLIHQLVSDTSVQIRWLRETDNGAWIYAETPTSSEVIIVLRDRVLPYTPELIEDAIAVEIEALHQETGLQAEYYTFVTDAELYPDFRAYLIREGVDVLDADDLREATSIAQFENA